jgi:hypothetical protein
LSQTADSKGAKVHATMPGRGRATTPSALIRAGCEDFKDDGHERWASIVSAGPAITAFTRQGPVDGAPDRPAPLRASHFCGNVPDTVGLSLGLELRYPCHKAAITTARHALVSPFTDASQRPPAGDGAVRWHGRCAGATASCEPPLVQRKTKTALTLPSPRETPESRWTPRWRQPVERACRRYAR